MYFDKFYIPGSEGKRMAALLFFPEGKPRFKIIVAHGFQGRKENSGRIETFSEKITGIGGTLLCFDFTGCGDSEGSFADLTLSRQVSDMEKVVGYAMEYLDGPLVLLGRSFGGTTALAAAASLGGIEGLVLWSSPVFLEETFAPLLEGASYNSEESVWLEDLEGRSELKPGFFKDFAKHDISKYISDIGLMPILIIQGVNDTVVDPRNARFITERAKGPVEIHMVDGADHRFNEFQGLREDITVEWLTKTILQRI